ncbi:sirohydrochlorin cobaltochelatase [Cenarchaeum symbiosum A]|uniref:Sirohydrochlorin cobaltochelatase n=1 Tax=Cenarchaeum symbiosum (strain A) TaxID=414004 RepID=A0RYY3_CENSY|nr:sirohydrochlorin cobaltochelatase [Cenarchaeum symbiosum A]
MKRGLLVIDRGSREHEAEQELNLMCSRLLERGSYEFVDYCFLEVVPPFLDQGMADALNRHPDELTIVPYFLYPGRKVKAAVTDAMKFQAGTDVKLVVTRAMSMHRTMVDIVEGRILAALKDAGLDTPTGEVDVLIIGHGSKDPNAAISIRYLMDGLSPRYRNVDYCFLELEQPDIAHGIEKCKANRPRVLAVVFYFLHEGAHVKRDIYEDLNPALEGADLGKVVITKHIGADERMVDLILERAKEVEDAAR